MAGSSWRARIANRFPRLFAVSRFVRGTRLRLQDRKSVFLDIYQGNRWGDPSTVSGPGSSNSQTAALQEELPSLVRGLGIQVLLDAPCGEFTWVSTTAAAVNQYIGVDIVDPIIQANREKHSSPARTFLVVDLVEESLPAANAILCRDCLVHLSFRDIHRALTNFRATGARYLITTTFIARTRNYDIVTGQWRPINLERVPFSFPPPMELIDERCTDFGGIYRDKRLGVWKL